MLAFAATALTVALVSSLAAGDDMSPSALVVALIATMSGIAFLLGFAPPAGLRLLWRRPEQVRMQQAIGELMAATSEEEVAARVLPPMARMVGARGIALEATDGTRIGTYGSLEEPEGDVAQWEFPFGRLIVRTSAFAPFFGDEERKLLDRARLADGARARPGTPLRTGAQRPRVAPAGRRAEERVRRTRGARAPLTGRSDLRALGDDRRAWRPAPAGAARGAARPPSSSRSAACASSWSSCSISPVWTPRRS